MTETIGNFVPLVLTIQRAGIPQRVVMRPTIHIEEVRTAAGEKIPGQSVGPGGTCYVPGVPAERYAHESLHLCPHVSVPNVVLSRDNPPRQELSVSLQDQQREWDFLVRHRELVFDDRRIQMADSAWDKVFVLAEDIWTFRRDLQKPGGNDYSRTCPWSHPVDTLIYGSWCLGGAYALVALCATMGILAREVSICGHSVTEVHLGGQWCFVDSIQRFPKQGGCNMVRASWAEVRLDPANPKYGFIPDQQNVYWESFNLHTRGSENGLWLQQIRDTAYQPQTAMALYPGWSQPRFKSPYADRYDLLWGRSGFGYPELVVRQGQALGRRFWVGSLAATKSLAATFIGVHAGNGNMVSHNVPKGGGEWFIAVNGKTHSIASLGGWAFHKESRPANLPWEQPFEIPLAELRENSWNTLVIGCPAGGNGQFLALGGAGEWSLPEEPVWCGEV